VIPCIIKTVVSGETFYTLLKITSLLLSLFLYPELYNPVQLGPSELC